MPIQNISKEYVVDRLLQLPEKTKIQILSPINPHPGEDFSSFIDRLQRAGYLRIRLNKKYYELDENIAFDKSKKNEILLVIDRLIIDKKNEQEIA